MKKDEMRDAQKKLGRLAKMRALPMMLMIASDVLWIKGGCESTGILLVIALCVIVLIAMSVSYDRSFQKVFTSLKEHAVPGQALLEKEKERM